MKENLIFNVFVGTGLSYPDGWSYRLDAKKEVEISTVRLSSDNLLILVKRVKSGVMAKSLVSLIHEDKMVNTTLDSIENNYMAQGFKEISYILMESDLKNKLLSKFDALLFLDDLENRMSKSSAIKKELSRYKKSEIKELTHEVVVSKILELNLLSDEALAFVSSSEMSLITLIEEMFFAYKDQKWH